jgi:sugar (pentulose or hexulose) kinase
MSFIGIDLGTSFIKGAVLNLEVRLLEHTRRVPFPNRLGGVNPLLCEFDPNEIVTAVRTVIDELALHATDCEGVVMCSQMHGMVLMNERGETVSNCISWLDHRGMMAHPSGTGSYFDVLTQRTSPQQRRQLGNELNLERPICSLFWLAEQGGLKPGLMPVSMPDFVLSVLCGSPPGVELTMASAYGAFNLETLDWHHDVIKELGLSHLRWPVLRHQGEVVGTLKVGDHQVPCYTPVGDNQCAMVGAWLGTEELSLNISTGSQVSRLTAGLTFGDYQTRPFFNGRFLNTFTNGPGGRSLNVLVDLLGEWVRTRNIDDVQDLWSFIARAAKEVADTDLQVDLTSLDGPDGGRGLIANIRRDNLTVGHLFRAAFKDMADKYHTYALRLWPERAWKNLVFSGGLACKLEVLRETIKKKFGTDYRVSLFMEDTLFGLLILAFVFSGRARSDVEVTDELRSSYQGWTDRNSEGRTRKRMGWR